MCAFRSHIALLLLLCFARVLVPDAWVLALHAHEHTTHEPARDQRSKAVVTAQHKHCQTDHFYTAVFQPATPLELPTPPRYGAALLPRATTGQAAAQPVYSYLRGPPAG